MEKKMTKKMTKKFTSVVMALLMVLSMLSMVGCGKQAEGTNIRVGLMNGPTGIGAAYLMEESEKGNTQNTYEFIQASAATDLVGQFTNGDLDIVALPSNLAANLYAKTSGNVQLLAINTLGVLYILENGNTVNSIADLAGKTIYSAGQGAIPEYTLNHLLRSNGLEPGEDVDVQYMTSEEVVALMGTTEGAICMLPVPYMTSVMMKNADTRIAVDVNDAWTEVEGDSSVITTGCVVVKKAFAEENPDAISLFLDEYEESINYAKENVSDAAALVAKFGITASEEVAAAAIPDCNLTFISGADMQSSIEGYYEILFEADPTSVGGAMPDEGIYYQE